MERNTILAQKEKQRRCLTGNTSVTDSVRYFQLSSVWLNRLLTMIITLSICTFAASVKAYALQK